MRDGDLESADPRLLAWEYVAMVEVVLGQYARSALGDPEQIADFVAHLFFEGAAGQRARQPA